MLIDLPAVGLREQRAERRRTIEERCEKAAATAMSDASPCVSWCHLNDEGKLLTSLIKNSVEICGDDDEDKVEETLKAFKAGQITRLITKSQMTGYGLNWQFCHRTTMFPSHSFEQYYQSVRRFLRYGQKHDVQVDMIASEGESGVTKNLQRKALAADQMFQQLVNLMGNELKIQIDDTHKIKTTLPTWL
jgi:hypothetical protein